MVTEHVVFPTWFREFFPAHVPRDIWSRFAFLIHVSESTATMGLVSKLLAFQPASATPITLEHYATSWTQPQQLQKLPHNHRQWVLSRQLWLVVKKQQPIKTLDLPRLLQRYRSVLLQVFSV
jgi:hypothetical protein